MHAGIVVHETTKRSRNEMLKRRAIVTEREGLPRRDVDDPSFLQTDVM